MTTVEHNVLGQHRQYPRYDVNLVNLIERFGSEEKCRDYLELLRWPDGVRCPRCGRKSISRVSEPKGNQFDCDSCRYQFSVTAEPVFHDSHLPLWKWFLATYLMCESKKGISAKQLSGRLESLTRRRGFSATASAARDGRSRSSVAHRSS